MDATTKKYATHPDQDFFCTNNISNWSNIALENGSHDYNNDCDQI